jgi:hypothetical protein
VIVAHHGGELPALLAILSGSAGFASVALILARERLGRWLDRRRDAARWRT